MKSVKMGINYKNYRKNIFYLSINIPSAALAAAGISIEDKIYLSHSIAKKDVIQGESKIYHLLIGKVLQKSGKLKISKRDTNTELFGELRIQINNNNYLSSIFKQEKIPVEEAKILYLDRDKQTILIEVPSRFISYQASQSLDLFAESEDYEMMMLRDILHKNKNLLSEKRLEKKKLKQEYESVGADILNLESKNSFLEFYFKNLRIHFISKHVGAYIFYDKNKQVIEKINISQKVINYLNLKLEAESYEFIDIRLFI